MPDCAAFLRGVNLGPRRRISGADLRSLFEEMGFGDVATFRTSGNVVFDAGGEPVSKLAQRIEEKLADTLGFEVASFVRTAADVRAIAEHQPFPPRVVKSSAGKLQVAMLASKPTAKVRRRALELATDEDRLAFADREVYWLPSGGTKEAALDMKTIEQLLGPTTMRTKGTLEQLAAKYFAG
jgi:uncharacterized protein (DUF1697 family)